SDMDALAYVTDGAAQGLFDDQKIVVLGAAQPDALAVRNQQSQYVDALEAEGYEADFEVLPCEGTTCTSGIGNAVRRIKSGGYTMIVLTTSVPGTALTPLFREMMNQDVRATLSSPTCSCQG